MPTDDIKILLVEDDDRIRREICGALTSAGFDVAVSVSAHDARNALFRKLDLVVLDLGLPDGDGLDICRDLRAAGNSVPVLILTARDAPDQRVLGLDAGADDYVIKPFHVPELVARVRTLLRRAHGTVAAGPLRADDVWADPESRSAGRGDARFDLKPREFDLLVFLLRHPGRAWTRVQLLDRVWGIDYDGDERTVDSHVRRLRAIVEDDASDPRFIETVWGVGYRWRSP